MVHQGYCWEYAPDHPGANRWAHMFQHRLVAEHYLGRRLLQTECVHHVDENKLNNHPSNLMAFPSFGAHQRHHQRLRQIRFQPGFAKRLRPLAEDPHVSLAQAGKALGICEMTVRKACQDLGVHWKSAGQADLSEQSVREALRGRTTAEAATALGTSHGTLRNRFPHLLSQRASPGILEAHKEEIRSLAKHMRAQEIGAKYGVNPETVRVWLHRWTRTEKDGWSDVLAFQQSRLGIRWSRGRTAGDRSTKRR